jgi:hypothetical protein
VLHRHDIGSALRASHNTRELAQVHRRLHHRRGSDHWSSRTDPDCMHDVSILGSDRNGIITLTGMRETLEHCRDAPVYPVPETVTRHPALPCARSPFACSVVNLALDRSPFPSVLRITFSITLVRAVLENLSVARHGNSLGILHPLSCLGSEFGPLGEARISFFHVI